MKEKIICIGFMKTGTTSLRKALNILGYTVKENSPGALLPILKGNYEKVFSIARNYDALADKPWFMIYKELDREFPGSKFILTIRDNESWYQSVSRHLGELRTAQHEWIYGRGKGLPKEHKENALKVYSAHNKNVTDYFRDRPGDLLILDLSKDDNWKKLCEFLGREIPVEQFPHLMKGADFKGYKKSFIKRFKLFRRRLRNHLLIKYIDLKGYW